MIVLGFDTSTSATAVALRLADGSSLQARDDPPSGAHPGHATRLLPMADELLARASIGWNAIERIAVGTGPGTFTGLRVGIASARGLAQSLSADLVGISSLKALAHAALAASSPTLDAPGAAILAVIDARRGEAFAAAYTRGEGGVPAELVEPAALPPQELAAVAARAEQAAAAGTPLSWLAVGDGALRFVTQLESAQIALAPANSPLHRVDANAICELAISATPGSLHELAPDYRRRPDAELALAAAGTAPAT